MLRILIVLALVLTVFAGGAFYEHTSSKTQIELREQIAELEKNSRSLKQKNLELNETLQLVKRQIQTDRIAYKSLQDAVEVSQQSRDELFRQVQGQQEILKKLREQQELNQ